MPSNSSNEYEFKNWPHFPYAHPFIAFHMHRGTYFKNPADYWKNLDKTYLFQHWVFWQMYLPDGSTLQNGPFLYAGYPHIAYQGLIHRYSPYDACEYQLVDSANSMPATSFKGSCKEAYDICAIEREHKNRTRTVALYYCLEKHEL